MSNMLVSCNQILQNKSPGFCGDLKNLSWLKFPETRFYSNNSQNIILANYCTVKG